LSRVLNNGIDIEAPEFGFPAFGKQADVPSCRAIASRGHGTVEVSGNGWYGLRTRYKRARAGNPSNLLAS